ncbi:MAG: hypothetical protein JSV78_03280 [Phycisphaerales bacterium]|nr:MAG: hypothetical protein JSV78_03280 [Phycisphaerales bacterium]
MARFVSSSLLMTLVVFMLLAGGCRTTRPDDALEPNNDFQTATRLTSGQPVDGRANEGNPDVFAIDATAGQNISYRLEDRGLEDCAAFTVTGPGNVILYRDGHFFCGRGPAPETIADGVTFNEVPDFGYELRVPAATAGTYFLTIEELGQADNLFKYSWDYRLTAVVEN